MSTTKTILADIRQVVSVPPSSQGGYNLDLFDLIKRKFWLISFFTILGIALSMLYFFKAPKTYRSTAKIFVDEKNASAVSNDGEYYANETSVEQYLLKRSRVRRSFHHRSRTVSFTNSIRLPIVMTSCVTFAMEEHFQRNQQTRKPNQECSKFPSAVPTQKNARKFSARSSIHLTNTSSQRHDTLEAMRLNL